MEIRQSQPGYIIVEIEKQFENYFNGIFLVTSRELLGRDDVETTVPKRIFGKVIAAPANYCGPEKPIIYRSEDIDDSPRQPIGVRYSGNGNQNATYREWGMDHIITVVPTKHIPGSHGKVFYEGSIQDRIQAGDTVWFHGVATEKANLIAKNTYAIPINQILAYQREGGEFTPFAGRIFLKPVRNQYFTSRIIIPDWVREAPQPVVGEIVHIGKPLNGSDVHPLLEEGLHVEFPKTRRWEVSINGKDLIVLDAEQITKIYVNNGNTRLGCFVNGECQDNSDSQKTA
jgi:co-chaperonin GroES (HSP10)